MRPGVHIWFRDKLLRCSAVCSLQITRSGDVQNESQAYTSQETRRRWLRFHSSCRSK